MNTQAEDYFLRADKWPRELAELRRILLAGGLTETLKWRSPCYTYGGKNIAILGQLTAACTLGFFQGALLPDPAGLLVRPGENSRSVRNLPYTDVDAIREQEPHIGRFIRVAVQVAVSGRRVGAPKASQAMPEELVAAFAADPGLQSAFASLTPGRQRGYLLHFTAAKRSATRCSRIEQSRPNILAGKGLHDCTCGLSQHLPRCDGSHKQLRT